MCFKYVSKIVFFLLFLIYKKVRGFSIRQLHYVLEAEGKNSSKNQMIVKVFLSSPKRSDYTQHNEGLRPDWIKENKKLF